MNPDTGHLFRLRRDEDPPEGARRFPDLPYRGQPDNRWSMELPTSTEQCLSTPRMAFAHFFDKLNGAGSWDANQWVWAVEFRRV